MIFQLYADKGNLTKDHENNSSQTQMTDFSVVVLIIKTSVS